MPLQNNAAVPVSSHVLIHQISIMDIISTYISEVNKLFEKCILHLREKFAV